MMDMMFTWTHGTGRQVSKRPSSALHEKSHKFLTEELPYRNRIKYLKKKEREKENGVI